MLQTEALLAALTVFAAFAAVIVICFLGYQMWLILRGLTSEFLRTVMWVTPIGVQSSYAANESFKLDDLQYDIKKGHLSRIPAYLYEKNKQFFDGPAPVPVVVEPPAETELKSAEGQTVVKRTKKAAKGEADKPKVDYVELSPRTRIRTPYSKGAWNNLMEVLFPPAL